MTITLKYLPMTEDMFDYITQEMIDKNNNEFIQVDKDRWSELINDNSNWQSDKHYFYKCGDDDMFYLLSKVYVFEGSKWSDYSVSSWNKLGLSDVYFYVFTYRATDKVEAYEFWTQGNSTEKKDSINGLIAWNKVQAQIHKHYTDDEIEAIINEHKVEDKDCGEILHMNAISSEGLEYNVIYSFNNVRYYDLNKAYASNLMRFFPKLTKWMLNGYKHNKAYFKKVINYAVGCMQNKTHYKKEFAEHNFHYLRNAIVTDTTNKMNQADTELSGMHSTMVYQNTDGFIIHNPVKELDHSKDIGDFGQEVVDNNQLWMVKVVSKDYQNYGIMQWFENGKKVIKSLGGFRLDKDLIEHTDLSKGIVPLFKMKPLVCASEGKVSTFRIIDKKTIKESKLNEQKY